MNLTDFQLGVCVGGGVTILLVWVTLVMCLSLVKFKVGEP